jgi:putative addiction module component (TIGR02574 family)
VTAIAKKIEQEIQQLTLEDMLALHERLVVSIHEREDSKPLDSAFREEIQRRIKDIDSGKAEGVDPFKALEEM